MSNNDQLPFNDLPEDDPLAPWRPDTPWPEEEKEFLRKLYIRHGHDWSATFEYLRRQSLDPRYFGNSWNVRHEINILVRLLLTLPKINEQRTLFAINQLGGLIHQMGDIAHATGIAGAIVELSSRNPDIADADRLKFKLNYLTALSDRIEVESAIDQAAQLKNEVERRLGKDSSIFARSHFLLGQLYAKAGRHSMALRSLEPAFEFFSKEGREFRDEAIASSFNIFYCIRETEGLRSAAKFIERQKRLLKLQTPYSRTSEIEFVNAYASALLDAEDALSAEREIKLAIDFCGRALPENHPATLKLMTTYGSTLIALGRFSEAVHVLRSVKRHFVSSGENGAWAFDVIANNLGVALGAAGSYEEADSEFAAAIRFLEGSGQKQEDKYVEFVSARARNLLDLCGPVEALQEYERILGRVRESIGNGSQRWLRIYCSYGVALFLGGDEKEGLRIAEECVRQASDSADLDHSNDISTMMGDLAVCYRDCDRYAEGRDLLERAIARSSLDRLHPENLTKLNTLATCYNGLGNRQKALSILFEVKEARDRIFGPLNPETLVTVGAIVGLATDERTFSPEVIPIAEAYLKTSEAVRGETHFEHMIAMNNLAIQYDLVGRTDESIMLCKHVIRLRESAFGKAHPYTIASKNNLSQTYAKVGDFDSAERILREILAYVGADSSANEVSKSMIISHLIIACARQQKSAELANLMPILLSRVANSRNRSEDWRRLAINLGRLLVSEIAEDCVIEWCSPFRAISRGFLEDLDLTEPSDVGHILGPFGEFHGNWLNLCLADGSAEEVPHVLQAIQGREMAAMLLAELEASEADYPAGDPRMLYLEVVRELRRLRLMLRKAEKHQEQGGGLDGGLDDGRRFRMKAEASMRQAEQREAVTEQRREEYARLIEQMMDLRGKIAELDSTFALAYRPPDVSVERLSEGIAGNEAKVLLFMHAREDGAELVPHACCITADVKAEVLVLDRMPAAREALSNAGLRGTARMGMRGGRGAAPLPKQDGEAALGEDDAFVEEQQVDLAALMGEALWQPLRAKYPQVTNWHLATHQDLHVLPVGLGLDPAHTMTVHPGLLFLARKQDEAVNDNVPSRLAMHSDPAAGTESPIPFVEAEVALAQLIWGEDRIAVSDGEETLARLNEADPPLDALLLAAHGDELDSEPPQTIVWLDRAEERMLDTTAVLSAGQRPPVVIASACVAGRIREDSLGEPLGLVSAFFLHGARFVLAPLQPIPDLQAPLVMGLFHRAWRKTRDPRRAWQVARDQALTGQWPEGYEKQLAAAYSPVMRAMLERAVTDDDYIYSVILKSGWNIKPADRAGLMVFEDENQLAVENRKALIDRLVTEGVDQILAEKGKAAQGKPSSAIRRICDWTMPFGS